MDNLNSKVRLKRQFSIICHSLDEVELRSGAWNISSFNLVDEEKKGKLANILQDLNGNFSLSELTLKHHFSREELDTLLDYLMQIGVIETSASNILDYYLDTACPFFKEKTSKNQQQISLTLIADDPLAESISTILKNSSKDIEIACHKISIYEKCLLEDQEWIYNGLLLEEKLGELSHLKDTFVALVFQNINPVLASAFNKVAYELGIPWIFIAQDGPFLFIGPTFLSSHISKGPCYDCLETRITMNLREQSIYQRYKNAILKAKIKEHSLKLFSPLSSLLASHASLEILNYLFTQKSHTVNKMMSIYLPTMEVVFNEVLRFSSCKTCGFNKAKDGEQTYFDVNAIIERTIT